MAKNAEWLVEYSYQSPSGYYRWTSTHTFSATYKKPPYRFVIKEVTRWNRTRRGIQLERIQRVWPTEGEWWYY